jgi:hypothetical protein
LRGRAGWVKNRYASKWLQRTRVCSTTAAVRSAEVATAAGGGGEEIADPGDGVSTPREDGVDIQSDGAAGVVGGAIVAAEFGEVRPVESDAGTSVPAAQLSGAEGVVREEEVLDGVLAPGAAAGEVRPDPGVDPPLVRVAPRPPLVRGEERRVRNGWGERWHGVDSARWRCPAAAHLSSTMDRVRPGGGCSVTFGRRALRPIGPAVSALSGHHRSDSVRSVTSVLAAVRAVGLGDAFLRTLAA